MKSKLAIEMKSYTEKVERRMKRLFQTLSEKDRRRYAAVEADKLGHGGTEYIAELFDLDPKTIRQGLADLEEVEELAVGRVRKKGRPKTNDRSNRLSGSPLPGRHSRAHGGRSGMVLRLLDSVYMLKCFGQMLS